MYRLCRLALLGAAVALPTAAHAADDRLLVEVPPAIRDDLMAEMRKHMDSLDDVVKALAAGDLDEAAAIAELRMDMGHRVWERMAAEGATDAEIHELRERMRALGTGPSRGQGVGGGKGPGRLMPDDFRAMGAVFHEAAQAFAATARDTSDPPTADDYARVLGALRHVTSTCRSCHTHWRVD